MAAAGLDPGHAGNAINSPPSDHFSSDVQSAWKLSLFDVTISKRIPVPKVARAFTKWHGVFTMGLAAGLKEYGLQVSFHSDPDTHLGGFEKRRYARAYRIGVLAEPAL
jgi:hypothetical protein